MSFDSKRPKNTSSSENTQSGAVTKSSIGKISRKDSQSIVINFYSTNRFKQLDKNTQTETEHEPNLEEIGIIVREYPSRREASTSTETERHVSLKQRKRQVEPPEKSSNSAEGALSLFKEIQNPPEKSSYLLKQLSYHVEKPYCTSSESQQLTKQLSYHVEKPSFPLNESSHFIQTASYHLQQESYQILQASYHTEDSTHPPEETLYYPEEFIHSHEGTLGSSMSNEKKEERSPESRKYFASDGKSKISARVASDLERKKLEAELKAAEEIAMLKQSLIEKRLALELATIQDGEYSQSAANTSPHAEIKALEELAMRKQSLIETNLAQELQSLDYQRIQNPPLNPPPPATRQPNISPSKLSTFITDSSSSVTKGLGILDKKFNLDNRFSGSFSTKPVNYFSQDKRFMDQQVRKTQDSQDKIYSVLQEKRFSDPQDRRYSGRDRRYSNTQEYKGDRYPNWPPQQPDYESQPRSRSGSGRAKAAWKMAVSKIKKSMRTKSPESYD